jgi:hypothetical protein
MLADSFKFIEMMLEFHIYLQKDNRIFILVWVMRRLKIDYGHCLLKSMLFKEECQKFLADKH